MILSILIGKGFERKSLFTMLLFCSLRIGFKMNVLHYKKNVLLTLNQIKWSG